ncbi:hypothetical protein DK846_13095 [Methanospirillum lacunae]|uniref:Uncharacterized protein n=2 Tax=Methanospirillum lacunae TaxID=668570 RepID=A0A2V2MU40_9EURY|nr:hypothetical protein DK846_13095 [Methanospirillum lacunae]
MRIHLLTQNESDSYQSDKRTLQFDRKPGSHGNIVYSLNLGEIMNSKVIIAGIIIVITICITGCLADQSENQTPVAPEKVTISDLLNSADKFADKPVMVEGKISSQCGSGCWFIMSDDNGDLYVNLKPNNFVIPPAMGKKVTVIGNVIIKDNDLALVGSSVNLDGKTYP